MSSAISFSTYFLSSLTMVGQLVILGILVVSVICRKRKRGFRFLGFISAHSLGLSFFVALTATAGSLFYSEIAGFDPCKLCWFQRIFMYPMVLILAIAWWKKDKEIFRYIMTLSVVGAIIASYHYLLQIGVAPVIIPCSTVGYSVSCAQAFSMTFGYITIPLMSLTAFLMIFLFARPERMLCKKCEDEKDF